MFDADCVRMCVIYKTKAVDKSARGFIRQEEHQHTVENEINLKDARARAQREASQIAADIVAENRFLRTKDHVLDEPVKQTHAAEASASHSKSSLHGKKYYDLSDPLPETETGEARGLDPMVFDRESSTDMEAASASLQKKLLARSSKMLTSVVSNSLEEHGIAALPAANSAEYKNTVWGAFKEVRTRHQEMARGPRLTRCLQPEIPVTC